MRTLFPSAVECLHACSCLERLLTAPRSWQETTRCLHWADKKEATEEGGERRRSGVVVGREGGRERGALANLQEGRLSHEMLAELQPLCMCVC